MGKQKIKYIKFLCQFTGINLNLPNMFLAIRNSEGLPKKYKLPRREKKKFIRENGRDFYNFF